MSTSTDEALPPTQPAQIRRIQEGDAYDQACWICLDGASPSNPLINPCACPHLCHRSCLVRWQLQRAGKSEETTCRFCKSALPDWRLAFEGLPRANPKMRVVHLGLTHRFPVQPGPEGLEAYKWRMREILCLRKDEEVAFKFTWKLPGMECFVTLEGPEAYDAAVYCASITAGLRKMRKAEQGRKRWRVKFWKCT